MTSFAVKTKNFLWRQALKYLVNPNKIVKVHGHRMHLDARDSLLLSIRKNYEPKHVELIKNIVKRGDVAVDVGANIGYYTLILARLVGPEGKVFAFEPDPENFKVLKRNIEANCYKNVIVEQKAVSDANEKIKVYFSNINNGDSRIYQPKEEVIRASVETEAVKLDDYFKGKDKPNFIKIDIQGAEPAAFKGMKNILKDKGLKFTAEFSPENLKSAGYDSEELLDFLRNNEFKLFDLDKGKRVEGNAIIKYYESINYFTTLYGFKANA